MLVTRSKRPNEPLSIGPFDGLSEIHISDVMTYKACRQQWSWSSRLRENLEPKRLYAPFFSGRAVHHCMERFYYDGTPFAESLEPFIAEETAVMRASGTIWEEEEQMIAEQTELVRGMLDHYALWEKRQVGGFSLSNLEFISLEQEFAIPLFNPFTGEISTKAFFAGKLDGVVRRKDNGDMYIWELKTARAIAARAKMLSNDEQATMYLNAAQYIFGPKVKGLLYTIMSKRVPARPAILTSGMLSKAVKDQSFDSYLAYVREYHGDAATNDFINNNYGPQLIALYEQENTHFQRHVVVRTDDALRNGMANLYAVAHEMVDKDLPIYPTPSFHCNYCSFREPCVAKQDGSIFDILLEDNFQQRKHHAGDNDAELLES